MNFKNFVLLGASALFALSSCNKETGGAPINPSGGNNSLSPVFENNLSNATQAFTVNAAAGGTIVGSKGTEVVFSPNAFRNQAGNNVNGMVDVELVEIQSIGDMLWLNKGTLGINGGMPQPLVSGGQIYLNATQNGAELALNSGGSFVSMVDFTPDPNMELFSGTVDNNGDIVWNPFAQQPGVQLDSSSYNFPNDSLGWINCDYFGSWGSPQSEIDINVPAGYDDGNTFVWVVFPTINSMTSVYSYANGVFSLNGGYTVPLGMDITIVALHDTGSGVESSFTNATVTGGFSTSIVFQPTTLGQFQTDCSAL